MKSETSAVVSDVVLRYMCCYFSGMILTNGRIIVGNTKLFEEEIQAIKTKEFTNGVG